MLYIILTVFVSVFLLVIFKLFNIYGIHTLLAIILNYAFAAITGLILLGLPLSDIQISQTAWLKIALPLGSLFLIVFYLISLTTQKMSISAASVSNKMSVVLPVLFSIVFLNQELNVYRTFGIILALLSVYLSTKKHSDLLQNNKMIWLPILVFVGSGLIDVSINAANAFYIKTPNDGILFSICTFMSAFVCGIILIIYLLINKKIELQLLILPKNILGGILLGVPNFFSIYFIFKALETSHFSSAQLFPVLNVSNVALSALTGLILFREKLSLVNITGIILAILSIILIAS